MGVESRHLSVISVEISPVTFFPGIFFLLYIYYTTFQESTWNLLRMKSPSQ
jgi:hypothetical protein